MVALARRTGLDANPLRRGSDRAEAWVRIALIVLFLVASPLAAAALGQLTSDASARAARAQAANEHQVTAILRKAPARTMVHNGPASPPCTLCNRLPRNSAILLNPR